ncbi:MAG: hypothetical protein JXR94_19525 [Candidatus Hydrogenedentes bacterium]|nr:hypothetical protein [Candidatus Hydrogenedentota bacterium]
MPLFSRPEYQIGRGETPESRVEVPFFVAFMVFSSVALLVFHLYVRDEALTIALAVSMVIFAITFLRVELGVYFLIVCMLLSPEIDAGPLGMGQRSLNLRYDDILIVVVFGGVLVKQAFEGENRLWRPSPINAGIAAYYLVCILSTLLALRRSLPLFEANKQATAFVMLKMAEFYMVFLLVGSAIRDARQIRRLLVPFFLVALVVAVYAISSRLSAVERVSAPFEKGGTEPNTLGGYLVIVICLAAALFTQAPTRKTRTIALVIAALGFFPLLYTLSRASYVALVAALLGLGVVARKPLLVAGIVVLLLLSPIIMPGDVQERVLGTFQPQGEAVRVAGLDTGITVDKSTHERLYVWQKVAYNLHFWPWLGGGVCWARVLDSQYARVLIETGLIGFIAFLFMQWRLLRTSLEAYRWSGDWVGRSIGLAAFASTIGLMVHSLGTISFLIVRVMEPFWLLMGLVVVVRALAIEDYVRTKEENHAREHAALAQGAGAESAA